MSSALLVSQKLIRAFSFQSYYVVFPVPICSCISAQECTQHSIATTWGHCASFEPSGAWSTDQVLILAVTYGYSLAL